MITVDSGNLITKLKGLSKSLEDVSRSGPVHDYLNDMWQTGYDEVKASYDMAVTLGGESANKSTSITSVPIWYKDGFELEAFGDDILFLEFGTGVNQDYTHPWGAELGYTPASYSINHYGFLIEPRLRHFHGQWPHAKKLHWGQNPARGMYNASKAMRFFLQIEPFRVF